MVGKGCGIYTGKIIGKYLDSQKYKPIRFIGVYQDSKYICNNEINFPLYFLIIFLISLLFFGIYILSRKNNDMKG